MKSSICFAVFSLSIVFAAYLEDSIKPQTRDLRSDFYLWRRDQGLYKRQTRGFSLRVKAGQSQKPAGGSGLGHSRLPIPPSKIPNPPPPPPSVKISKTPPLGAAKERLGWPLPSVADFQKADSTQGSKIGKATFLEGSGKAQFVQASPKPAGGGILGKFGIGNKKSDKIPPGVVESRNPEVVDYVSRTGIQRPSLGASFGAVQSGSEMQTDHSSRRELGQGRGPPGNEDF